MKRLHASILVLAVLVLHAAHATDVCVSVLNVGSALGWVRVAVCTRTQWAPIKCAYGARVPAQEGRLVVVVHDVPAGDYGVLVHHDANADNAINRSLVGKPTEGIGFSRDAPIRFGMPSFDAARITVADVTVDIDVHLVFEPQETVSP
jgi:uncharacterized protein (DUF2141 family)